MKTIIQILFLLFLPSFLFGQVLEKQVVGKTTQILPSGGDPIWTVQCNFISQHGYVVGDIDTGMFYSAETWNNEVIKFKITNVVSNGGGNITLTLLNQGDDLLVFPSVGGTIYKETTNFNLSLFDANTTPDDKASIFNNNMILIDSALQLAEAGTSFFISDSLLTTNITHNDSMYIIGEGVKLEGNKYRINIKESLLDSLNTKIDTFYAYWLDSLPIDSINIIYIDSSGNNLYQGDNAITVNGDKISLGGPAGRDIYIYDTTGQQFYVASNFQYIFRQANFAISHYAGPAVPADSFPPFGQIQTYGQFNNVRGNQYVVIDVNYSNVPLTPQVLTDTNMTAHIYLHRTDTAQMGIPNGLKVAGDIPFIATDTVLTLDPTTGLLSRTVKGDSLYVNNGDTIIFVQQGDTIVLPTFTDTDSIYFNNGDTTILILRNDTIFADTTNYLPQDSFLVSFKAGYLYDANDTTAVKPIVIDNDIYFQLNEEAVEDVMGVALTNGDHTNIVITYNDNTGGFAFSAIDTSGRNQSLTITNDTLFLTDADTTLKVLLPEDLVFDGDSSVTNELQDIDSVVLLDNLLTVYISNGASASVNLSGYTPTDRADTSGYNLTFYIQNDSLNLTDGIGNLKVDLSPYLDNTDTDSIVVDSLGTLLVKNRGDVITLIPDTDTDTDKQNLSLVGDSLLIERGTGVDLSGYLDNTDTDTIIVDSAGLKTYTVTRNGTIYIPAGDGTGTDTSGYNQSFTKVGDSLILVDGTTRFAVYDPDAAGGGFVLPTDSITFNNNEAGPDSAELNWDATLGYLVFGGVGNQLIQIGQDQYWMTINKSNELIEKGDVVMAVGAEGNSGKFEIAKFIADGSIDVNYLLGVAAQDIPHGTEGYVMHQGKIRQIDLTDYQTGQVLYVSPTVAGDWVTTEPSNGYQKLPIAFVVDSSANGTLAVRVKTGEALRDLHDVDVSSPADGSLISYDSLLGYWVTKADSVIDDDADSLNEIQIISKSNDTVYLSKNGGFILDANIDSFYINYYGVTTRVAQGDTFYISNEGIYPDGYVHCAEPTVVNPVTSTTGAVWMDRNLGASQVATSSTDAAAYGDLYQWGRFADGHQCRTSGTTSTNATTAVPFTGGAWDSLFILETVSPNDWLTIQDNNLWQGVNGVNNPCPSGYRLPTKSELDNERLSWSSNNSAGAFASPLKLPVSGYRFRSSGGLLYVGSFGRYWSSSVSGSFARYLDFGSGYVFLGSDNRAMGYAVRCIKDAAGTNGIYDNRNDSLNATVKEIGITEQLSFDNSTLLIDGENNRVGIGTSSPSEVLDVVGDVEIDGKIDLNDGGNSVFVGTSAGSSTTGVSNVAIGHQAALANTTGFNNTGVGFRVLYSNLGGFNNSGFGFQTLYSNTSGYANTANGIEALLLNTTGHSNTSNGFQSLRFNTIGANNTAAGFRAGMYVSSGANNTITNNSLFIGYDTRPKADNETNQIVIGYQGRGEGSNSIKIGNSSHDSTFIEGIKGQTTGSPPNVHITADGRLMESTYTDIDSFYINYYGDIKNIQRGDTISISNEGVYPDGYVHCAEPTKVNPVVSTTGQVWMDRNLGASQVATSSTDANAYGDLFQWGRFADGHQCRNSGTTTTNATTAQPFTGGAWDSLFIIEPNSPYDWLTTKNDNLWQGLNGVNNPCPTGYRVPTISELEEEKSTWPTDDLSGAFSNPLKFTAAGLRVQTSGSIFITETNGYYISNSFTGTNAWTIRFDSTTTSSNPDLRARAYSLRCIKDKTNIDANGIYDIRNDSSEVRVKEIGITEQLSFDNSTLVIDGENNRVGIGTASPSEVLDVVGDVEIDGKLDLNDGGDNTFVGTATGESITSGTRNTGIGYRVLRLTNTGIRNTAIGFDVLYNNSSGRNNLGIGYATLYNNLSGSYNSTNGDYALFGNTIGSNNVAIGYESGQRYGTGSSNSINSNNSIFIGYDARPSADNETNQIVIGYEGRGEGSNTIKIGNSSHTGAYITGIKGQTTGSAPNVHITSDGRLMESTVESTLFDTLYSVGDSLIFVTPAADTFIIEIESISDQWGGQVVQTDATLSGDGTSGNPLTIAQQLATDGQVLKWDNTAGTWLPANDIDTDTNTDEQDIDGLTFDTLTGSLTVGITSGSSQTIDLDGRYLEAEVDGSTTNELQNLSLAGDSIKITNGTGIDISAYLDNTDTDSILVDSLGTILVKNRGDVITLIPDTDEQNLSIVSDSLLIDRGSGVDLSVYLDNTDTSGYNSALSLVNDTLYLTDGNGTLGVYVPGDDWGDDVVQTDATLTGNGTAGSPLSVVFPADEVFDGDSSVTNEIQNLSIDSSGRVFTVTIENGNSVSFEDQVDDADASATNELQTISIDSTGRLFTISLTNGDSVKFEDKFEANTDIDSTYFRHFNIVQNITRGDTAVVNYVVSDYPDGYVHCDTSNITKIISVTSTTGRIWMDRNLGASRAAISSTDTSAYGDSFQWGRFADGHQCRNSATTSTNATTAAPNLGNTWDGKFITESFFPYDWLTTQNDTLWQGIDGINNPCPTGYRVPTESELNAERLTWSSNNSAGAFSSPLKLPNSGGRYFSSGGSFNLGSGGAYWSSSVSAYNSRYLSFTASDADLLPFFRTYGLSLRCIKDQNPTQYILDESNSNKLIAISEDNKFEWVDASTIGSIGTDDQTITDFTFNGDALVLSIAIEDGNTDSVNLSVLKDGDGLWDSTNENLPIQVRNVPFSDSLKFDDSTLVIDAIANQIGINTLSPSFDLDVNGKIGLGSNQALYYPFIHDVDFAGSVVVGNGGQNLSNSSGAEGAGNTFVGWDAGEDNTNGYYNTFIGNEAGMDNTIGDRNTAIGYQAGRVMTGSNENTLLGFRAGYNLTVGANYNTMFGVSAGNDLTTGDRNQFIGHESGRNLDDDFDNTFIGYRAGLNLVEGDDNIFIGSTAGSLFNGGNLTNAFNSIAIGENAKFLSDSTFYEIVIGSSSVGAGAYSMTLGSPFTNKTIIRGIATSSTGSAANVYIDAQGRLYKSTSSLKYKQNIRDYNRSISELMQMRPVLFQSKGDDSGRDFAGFIAEEIDELGMTEFVQYDKEGKPDALNYANMTALLVKTIQDQQKQIEALTKRIEELENK